MYQRVRIRLWPRGIKQRSVRLLKAEISPECAADVRCYRIQRAQQNRCAFACKRRALTRLHGFQRIEHFHRSRDDGVVLLPFVVEVRLFQRRVQLEARFFLLRVERADVEAGRPGLDVVGAIYAIRPYATQEAQRTFDCCVRPHGWVFRAADEHDVEARGIGTVSVDQVLRVDAVPLALAHLADAVVLNDRTIGECAAVDVALLVERIVNVGRRDVILGALRGRLEENVI